MRIFSSSKVLISSCIFSECCKRVFACLLNIEASFAVFTSLVFLDSDGFIIP